MSDVSLDKKSFKCEACGAEATYSAEYQSLKCEFCGKVTQLIQDNQIIPTTCDFVIPLTLTDKILEIAAYEYMSSGEYTRDDVIEKSRILKIEKIYAPFFRFEGQYSGTWTASFGYYRKETYTDWEKDSNGFTRPVTKTRTVTDWSPVSGILNGTFDLAGYAGSELSENVTTFIEADLNLENTTSDPINYVAGLSVENLSQPIKVVFNERVYARYDNLVREEAISNAQGDEQRDWTWKANCTYEVSSVLVPICHVLFEYEEKQYNVWVDGSDPSRKMGDSLPTDESRQSSVNIGFLPLGLAILGTLVLWAFLQDQPWLPGHPYLWSCGAICVAALYGYIRKSALLGYSEEVRNAVLAFQKASLTNISEKSNEEQQKIANSFVKPTRGLFSSQSDLVSLFLSAAVVGLNVFIFSSTTNEIKTASSSYRSNTNPTSLANRPTNYVNNQQTTPPANQTSNSSNLSNAELCRRVLDGTQSNWDTGIAYQDAVREAARRNITIAECRQYIQTTTVGSSTGAQQQQIPSTQYPNTASPSGGSYRGKSLVEVCWDALNSNQNGWDSDPAFREAVAEAQRRGMTIASCLQSINSSSRPNQGTSGNQSSNSTRSQNSGSNQRLGLQTYAPRHTCDDLAANPTDLSRLSGVPGTPFTELRKQSDSALAFCRQAVQQYPSELRFRYQMARSLQFSDRAAAFELFRQLVVAGYPAAFDNLGWMYFRDYSNPSEAFTLFMLGAQRNDPDSIVSLAEMIDRNVWSFNDKQSAKIGLFQLASEVGHYNAQRVLQTEIQRYPRALTQREIEGLRDEMRDVIARFKRR